jgi:uncharacterized protein
MKTENFSIVETAAAINPTVPAQRILSIDVLRGFALMGILVSNIQVFAMIYAATSNPAVFGDLTGGNYVVATLSRVLVSGKFFPLFSMLFGAGIFLMAQKIEAKGGKPEKQHLMRMIWLIIIGWLHIFLLWDGDILFAYGVCGLAVFLLRKMPPLMLLLIALVLVFIPIFQGAQSLADLSSKTPEQLTAINSQRLPDQDTIDKEIAQYRGSWTKMMSLRVSHRWSGFWETGNLIDLGIFTGWMLLGMALFKFGLLTGKAPMRVLLLLLVLGLGIALPLRLFAWISNSLHNWNLIFPPHPAPYIYWENILRSALYCFIPIGYIAGIMMICRSGKLRRPATRLAAVGRMALTNYLVHSIICTTIFFGHGLGQFGRVERMGQFLVVVLTLALQLWYSPLWLKHFRFGPAEWLWRSLTYWKIQPMKIR